MRRLKKVRIRKSIGERKKSKILICGFTGKKMNFVLFCFDFESDGENIAPGWVIVGARFWSNPKSKFNWSVPLMCFFFYSIILYVL